MGMAEYMMNAINKSKSKEENTMNAYDSEHKELWEAVLNAHRVMYEAAKSLYFKNKIYDVLGYDSNNVIKTAQADLDCAMGVYEEAYLACYEHESRYRENYRISKEWYIDHHYSADAEIELYELKIEG